MPPMRNAVDYTPIWRRMRPSYFVAGVLDRFLAKPGSGGLACPLSSAAPRLRHPHAGERRRHPLHPGVAGPCGPLDHRGLHARVDPEAQRDPREDPPGAAHPYRLGPAGGAAGTRLNAGVQQNAQSLCAAVLAERLRAAVRRRGGRITCVPVKRPRWQRGLRLQG
jgi:hypothetical protein